jgi:hypothetical protein
VQLALPSGALTEDEAGARLMPLLGDLPAFAKYAGPHLPDITVFEGGIPADVPPDRRVAGREDAAPLFRSLRDRFASLVSLTPVYNRADWARTWRPEPRFRPLVVDNASTDGTAEIFEAAGAQVVRQPKTIDRVLNWRSALETARDRTDGTWFKWLFAGDELLPGAAATLEDAIAAYPEARMIVTEYLLRDRAGRTSLWRTVGETRLLEPAESMRRAADGNWFGGPIAHCVHRDAIDDAQFGIQPWAADYQACVNIARRHPVLYLAEPVGVLDRGHRQYLAVHEDRVRSVSQEWTVRLDALDAWRELADEGSDVDAVERGLHVQMVQQLAGLVQRLHG